MHNKFKFCFLELSGIFFFLNILYLRLVEPVVMEPQGYGGLTVTKHTQSYTVLIYVVIYVVHRIC